MKQSIMKSFADRKTVALPLLFIFLILLFMANMIWGAVDIPAKDVLAVLSGGDSERESWNYIILETRLPQAVTALLAGASISVAGLMLQTLFGNPLAGPEVLGISGGAGLGVADAIQGGHFEHWVHSFRCAMPFFAKNAQSAQATVSTRSSASSTILYEGEVVQLPIFACSIAAASTSGSL